jgi:hypothetical protein
MAIIKQYETPQGVTALYHKIIRAEIQPAAEMIEIWVGVFASPETRAANKGQLWTEYVRIPFGDLSDDPRAALYSLISSHPSSYLVGGVSDATPTETELALTE